jgi:hypothetical protein
MIFIWQPGTNCPDRAVVPMSTYPNEERWTDSEGKRVLERSFSVRSFVSALAFMLILRAISGISWTCRGIPRWVEMQERNDLSISSQLICDRYQLSSLSLEIVTDLLHFAEGEHCSRFGPTIRNVLCRLISSLITHILGSSSLPVVHDAHDSRTRNRSRSKLARP